MAKPKRKVKRKGKPGCRHWRWQIKSRKEDEFTIIHTCKCGQQWVEARRKR